MSELKSYIARVEEAAQVDASASNVEEAKTMKKDLDVRKKRLRLIKREVNVEMKRIRSNYKQKRANTTGGLAELLGSGSKERGRKKRSLTREKRSVLAPYEELKHVIDETVLKIDTAQFRIDEWVQRAEAGDLPEDESTEVDLTPQTSEDREDTKAEVRRWYDRTWVVLLSLLVFFPVGFYALYKNRPLAKRKKWIIAGVAALIVIAAL